MLQLSTRLKKEKCSAETAALLSSLSISLQNPEVMVKPVIKESHKRQKNVKIEKFAEPIIKSDSLQVAVGEPNSPTFSTLHQYSICSADFTQPNPMAYIFTNQLLISRVSLAS